MFTYVHPSLMMSNVNEHDKIAIKDLRFLQHINQLTEWGSILMYNTHVRCIILLKRDRHYDKHSFYVIS